MATTAALGLLVVAVCLVGAWTPDALPLCFGPQPTTAAGGVPQPVQGPSGVACPSEDAPPTPGTRPRRLPASGDVTLVALALLKLPSGALSALIGLLFVRGEFIPGLSQLDNQPQILAYAFLFGIAQQLITGTVDRQAQEILNKMPSKEPVSTKPQPRPAEGPTQALGRPERPRFPWLIGR